MCCGACVRKLNHDVKKKVGIVTSAFSPSGCFVLFFPTLSGAEHVVSSAADLRKHAQSSHSDGVNPGESCAYARLSQVGTEVEQRYFEWHWQKKKFKFLTEEKGNQRISDRMWLQKSVFGSPPGGFWIIILFWAGVKYKQQ